MLTAVCHTKPNPRLSGFQMPGLDEARTERAGAEGPEPHRGVSLGGGATTTTIPKMTTTTRETRVSRTTTTAL